MKRFYIFFGFLAAILITLAIASNAKAQTGERETYTGTVLSFGSGFNTRTVTRSFTLTIDRKTSNEQAQQFLETLREDGQDRLLREINNERIGSFTLTGNVGVPINVVRETIVDGKRRIFVVFERSRQLAELRGGYRSIDYPFGVIEIFIDEQTGKGEGTYIAAARIDFDFDEKKQQYQVEIENFGTYPARLLAVTQQRDRPARRRARIGN